MRLALVRLIVLLPAESSLQERFVTIIMVYETMSMEMCIIIMWLGQYFMFYGRKYANAIMLDLELNLQTVFVFICAIFMLSIFFFFNFNNDTHNYYYFYSNQCIATIPACILWFHMWIVRIPYYAQNTIKNH